MFLLLRIQYHFDSLLLSCAAFIEKFKVHHELSQYKIERKAISHSFTNQFGYLAQNDTLIYFYYTHPVHITVFAQILDVSVHFETMKSKNKDFRFLNSCIRVVGELIRVYIVF